MNTETSGKVTKARRFLERLGLSYDAMSPSTRKYLLDMEPSDSMNTNPAMVMSKQFDTIVDKEMEPMRGGRVSFPASYFGAPESPSYESVGGGRQARILHDARCRGAAARVPKEILAQTSHRKTLQNGFTQSFEQSYGSSRFEDGA